jgi:hypothetical protein
MPIIDRHHGSKLKPPTSWLICFTPSQYHFRPVNNVMTLSTSFLLSDILFSPLLSFSQLVNPIGFGARRHGIMIIILFLEFSSDFPLSVPDFVLG